MMEQVVAHRSDERSEVKVAGGGAALGLKVGIGSDDRYVIVNEIARMHGPHPRFFVLVLEGVG